MDSTLLSFNSSINNKERLNQNETAELKNWVSSFQETLNVQFTSTIFFRHVNFVNLEKVNKNVVYVNLIRDPVSRFESGFHYRRQRVRDDLLLTEACYNKQKLTSIKKDIKSSWVDQNFHEIPDASFLPNDSHRYR